MKKGFEALVEGSLILGFAEGSFEVLTGDSPEPCYSLIAVVQF